MERSIIKLCRSVIASLRHCVIASLLLFGCVLPTAYADLPLTIEDLLTAEKRWRTDVNLVYANSDRRNVDSRYGTIQTGPGQFISVPIAVGQAR
jgi:hypothetical protein